MSSSSSQSKPIKGEAFLEHLRKKLLNRELDFVAAARTPWNALGVEAALNERFDNPSGLIAIQPYPPKGFFLSPSDFTSINQKDIEFVYVEEGDRSSYMMARDAIRTLTGFTWARTHYSDSREICIIAPGDSYRAFVRIFSNRKISRKYIPKIISIDRALLSYQDNPKVRESSIGPSLAARSLYEYTYSFIENRYFEKIPKTERLLFNKNKQGLIVNPNVRDGYQKVLPDVEQESSNTALIITQPLSEIGYVSQEQELAAMNRVINKLRNKGLCVVIRPHPREDSSKYKNFAKKGIEISNNDRAVERDIPNINPMVVVGVSSTALLTTSVLYEISSYTIIGELNDEKIDKHTSRFVNLSKNYVKPFSEFLN